MQGDWRSTAANPAAAQAGLDVARQVEMRPGGRVAAAEEAGAATVLRKERGLELGSDLVGVLPDAGADGGHDPAARGALAFHGGYRRLEHS